MRHGDASPPTTISSSKTHLPLARRSPLDPPGSPLLVSPHKTRVALRLLSYLFSPLLVSPQGDPRGVDVYRLCSSVLGGPAWRYGLATFFLSPLLVSPKGPAWRYDVTRLCSSVLKGPAWRYGHERHRPGIYVPLFLKERDPATTADPNGLPSQVSRG